MYIYIFILDFSPISERTWCKKGKTVQVNVQGNRFKIKEKSDHLIYVKSCNNIVNNFGVEIFFFIRERKQVYEL